MTAGGLIFVGSRTEVRLRPGYGKMLGEEISGPVNGVTPLRMKGALLAVVWPPRPGAARREPAIRRRNVAVALPAR